MGDKFCFSGGIPNDLLAFGKPDDVRAYCKKVIDGVARDGGYIMDASAIMQDDTKLENLRAMTEATREYGVLADECTGRGRHGNGSAGLPPEPDPWNGRKRPPGSAFPGKRRARVPRRFAATRNWSPQSGKTSTPWPTPIFGNACCPFDEE